MTIETYDQLENAMRRVELDRVLWDIEDMAFNEMHKGARTRAAAKERIIGWWKVIGGPDYTEPKLAHHMTSLFVLWHLRKEMQRREAQKKVAP